MNRFFLKKIVPLVLFVTFALTPSAYAQRAAKAAISERPTVNTQLHARKRVEAEAFARTELFFGTARPDRPPVTEEEWLGFLSREITPRFPDGLTVLTGIGQFRDSTGEIIRETAIVLILLYPVETLKSSSKKIEEIREAYKEEFQQQSVLRVDDLFPSWVSF